MSYVYSNRLCDEALRIMKSDDSLESKLSKAFGEMGVSKYGDTSDEIWDRWKVLQKRYRVVCNEIFKQREEGVIIEGTPIELKKFGELLIELIKEWKEFNNSEINKGRLQKPE